MKRIVCSPYGIAMIVVGMLESQPAIAAPNSPTITSWSNGAYINNTAQTIRGGCVSGNSIRIYGQFIGSPVRVNCSASSYSHSFNFTSKNGAKLINVTATDATGTSTVNSRTLTLDTSTPSAPTFLSPASGSTVNARNITLQGGCESGAKVTLSGSLINSGSVVDCISGAYSLALQLTDGDGAKSISAYQTDRALNQSASAKLSINLRVSSSPSLSAPSITSPVADAYVNVVEHSVSGSCQSGATVNINGNIQNAPHAVACSNGAYSRSVTLTSGDGAKAIRVSQTATTLTSTEVSRSLTLDTVAPSSPSVTSPASGTTITDASINVVGACETSAVVSLSGAIQNSPRTATCANGAYSIAASLTTGNGAKALSITQSDRAGNVSGARTLNLTLSGGGTTTNPGNFLTIFDCHSGNFIAASNSSVPCAVDVSGWQPNPNGFMVPGSSGEEASVQNGRVYLSRGDGGHLGTNMVYQKPVNARAFEATFTFIPSGKNIAFVLQNASPNSYGFSGKGFTAGAGCEAGFFQAYGGGPAVDNIFALALMQDMPLLSVNDNPNNDYFTYSSAMIYKEGESPCSYMPTPSWANETPFSIPSKVSTYPVALNSPADRPLTSTGHNYEAKITYDGSNVTLNLRNLTTGGTCPGSTCFTRTWSNVNIPALVKGNTAYVSISAGCNSDCQRLVNVNSFKYAAPSN